MQVAATNFKQNIGKYFKVLSKEDIYITKNDKIIARLTNPYENRVSTLDSLVGIIPDNINEDKILSGRNK